MNIAGLTQSSNQLANLSTQQANEKLPGNITAKDAFQDFVAGTFFKQMLKALRSTQGETPYIDGGQAEKMFRSQLDQQIAEDLAKTHGATLADPLYPAFSAHFNKTA